MSNNHPNCIFIFFFKTAHFVTKIKLGGHLHCIFVFMPPPAKKCPKFNLNLQSQAAQESDVSGLSSSSVPSLTDHFTHLKAGTHQPNLWTSEAFGETRTRSGTNMFHVFSCVESFRSRVDVVCSNSTCGRLAVGRLSHWIL